MFNTIRNAMVFALLTMAHIAYAASATDITGYWRTIDDKTQQPRALIHIEQQANGQFTGTYVKTIATPKYTVCQHCPAPFTDKPIKGMQLLWGLTATDASAHDYQNGRIIDPTTGSIYRCKATLSDDGKKLSLRGYIGISLIGRTQTWYRDDNTAP